MKLFFGVQATGNGHVSASRLLVAALKAAGHSVTVMFSGQKRAGFWRPEEFEPFIERRGLSFVARDGRVRYAQTATQLSPLETIRDVRDLDLRGYDAVISNFEPISAWAAKWRGLPSIGISHQAAFRHGLPKAPGNYMARGVLRAFAPARLQLGLHWHPLGKALIPPMIESSLRNSEAASKRQVLVCLPYEDWQTVVARLLIHTSHEFLFHADVAEPQQLGHVRVLPFSRDEFLTNLRACEGVICHAGFELPSEALHLGKKLLVKPINGQYEQLCNALALQSRGLGRVMHEWSDAAVNDFLQAPNPVPKHYPDVAQALAQWIGVADLARPNAQEPLVDQLWQGVPT